MRASLERHCEHRGTIRVHQADDGDWQTPSPYFWLCGCSFNYDGDPECIYLGGFTTKMTPTVWQAIRELLHREGFVYIVWEKLRPDGRMDKVRGNIEKNARVFGSDESPR